MKSTKRVVAYALALSVASQALPSINVYADELTNENLVNTQSSSVFSLPGINLVGDEISVEYNTSKESVGEVSGFAVKVYSPSNPSKFTFIDLNFVENDGIYSVSDSITIPSSLQDSDSIMVELYSDNGELSKVFGPKKFELVETVVPVVEEVAVQTEVEEVALEEVASEAVLDTTAPSSNSALEYKIDSKNNKVMITQRGIYDLESGLDVHNVKAYVYPTGSENKGTPIELDGNDFSDFTGVVALPSEDSIIEVHASDLAGNSALVSSSVISAKDLKSFKSINAEQLVTGLFSKNLFYNNGDYYVKPGNEFMFKDSYKVLSDDLTKGHLIINTDANDRNSGVVFKCTVTSKGFVADGSFKDVEIISSSLSTEDELKYDLVYKLLLKDSLPHDTKLYFWSAASDDDSSTEFFKYECPLVVDSKAPTALTDEPTLELDENSTLTISQIGIGDQGTGIDANSVYALVKNDSLKDPIKVNLVETPVASGIFSGSVNLSNLGIDRGVFKVEIYAKDKVGNEALVSTGEVGKGMSLESRQEADVSGEKYETSEAKWFKYNSEIYLGGRSMSKDAAYDGAQIIINEDSSNRNNKVVAEFKLGSKEDLTNIENNPYFELVSKNYTTMAPNNSNRDALKEYYNEASVTLKFKDRAFNKNYTVWVKFYTNDGRESKFVKTDYTVNTDYERPIIKVEKGGDQYLVEVSDKGSGLASVVAYDSNGAIITEDFSPDGTLISDGDFAKVIAIDNVGNKTVFDVVNNKLEEPSGDDILPSKPTEQDSYIDLNGNNGGSGNQNQGGGDQNQGGDGNQGNGDGDKPDQGNDNQGNGDNSNQNPDQGNGNGDQGNGNQGDGDNGNQNGNNPDQGNGNQNGGNQNPDQGNGDQNGGNQGGNSDNGGNQNGNNPDQGNGNQNGGNSDNGGNSNGGNSNGGSSTTNPNNPSPNGDNGNNNTSGNGTGNNVSGNGSANGQTSNGGNSTNSSTNPSTNSSTPSNNGDSNGSSAALPFTGGTDTSVLGLFGGLMSTLGYVLFRKKRK